MLWILGMATFILPEEGEDLLCDERKGHIAPPEGVFLPQSCKLSVHLQVTLLGSCLDGYVDCLVVSVDR